MVMRFGGVGLSSRCPSWNALLSLVSCVNANEETQERDENWRRITILGSRSRVFGLGGG